MKGWLALSHCGHLRVDKAPSLLIFMQCGWWHYSLPLGDLSAASSDMGRQRKDPGVILPGFNVGLCHPLTHSLQKVRGDSEPQSSDL